jgi:hypothetical protein
MQDTIGATRLATSTQVSQMWLSMHHVLRKFQSDTGFFGKASDWPEHKQTLRSKSWKGAYKPAMVAYCQLGIFVQDAKKREAWIDAEDALAGNPTVSTLQCWKCQVSKRKTWSMASRSIIRKCWLGSRCNEAVSNQSHLLEYIQQRLNGMKIHLCISNNGRLFSSSEWGQAVRHVSHDLSGGNWSVVRLCG